MSRQLVMEAVARLAVHESVEFAPPRRERTILTTTAEDAAAMIAAIREPCVVRVSRPEERKFIIKVTTAV